MAFQF